MCKEKEVNGLDAGLWPQQLTTPMTLTLYFQGQILR